MNIPLDFQTQKKAGALDEIKAEIEFILDGIKQNHISKKELGRSAAIGSIISALAGAGIGAATGKKGKKKRRAIIGALLGALPGAAIGPVVAQYGHYMAGKPFKNDLNLDDIKPGQKVRIGVAGSANGEGDGQSWFAREMRSRFPGSNYMLRHVDRKKLEEVYKKLKEKGADVTVVGHSSGGKPAAEFLHNHPEVKGYLIDPVSWFGRKVPNNAVVFTSDKSTRHGGPSENTIADIGGRWNYEGPNAVVYKGSHSDKIRQILRDFVEREVRPGGKIPSWADYVTSAFVKESQHHNAPMQKSAQIHGYYAPAHDADAARSQQEFVKDISDKIKDKLPHVYTLQDTARNNYFGKNDPYFYNILVGGANAAGDGMSGWSYLPFGVMAKGKNNKLFRWNESDKIKHEIDEAVKQGKHVRVFGHSWGGSTVANLANDYPNIKFYALDPVSRTRRLKHIPDNLTILRPSEDSKIDEPWTNRMAAKIGGRWPMIKSQPNRYIEYYGGHVDGIDEAVNKIVSQEWRDRILEDFGNKLEKKYGLQWTP